MPKLIAIEDFLNNELSVDDVPDYPAAHNGMQLANSGEVTKIASAVDGSLPVIEKAIDQGADLLLVHHGLFWHGVQRLVGGQYEKFAKAILANLAVYSAHIPLDIHPDFGNNVLLAKAIGLNNTRAFHQWNGIELGLKQFIEIEFDQIISRLEKILGASVHYCRGRREAGVGMVGIITGGAGSEIRAMADHGINTFITGEGPHWSHPLAEELGVNIIYAGHYATETFGVKWLGEIVAEKWGVPHVFIDHPTGI